MTPHDKHKGFGRIPSFSVILLMVVAMVIGAAMLPLLKLQYNPSEERSAFTVFFTYPNVSARVVESEVTSKIEGALATIDGVSYTTSTSQKGGGRVAMFFKKGTNIETARFEVATQIRQIYDRLPEGVGYPWFNMTTSGGNVMDIMSYTINANMPPELIVRYAREKLNTPISKVEGVSAVKFSGATPFEWVIRFDPDRLRHAGLSPNDISSAFSDAFASNIVGNFEHEGENIMVRVRGVAPERLEDMPIGRVGERIMYLRDFASVTYEEVAPQSYYRINGLNTVNMYIEAEEGVNVVRVAQNVRKVVEECCKSFPHNYTMELTYDQSETITKEIRTIVFRSVLSLVILLLFVLVVSRSIKYLAVIALTIVANLFIAVIFYYVGGVEINLYSLAGLTVSLGIIIDTSIVMIDHYSYYRNRKVFTSILGALLTTIAALCIIFWLPDRQRMELEDFAWVIIINLAVSMLIALLFVPALLDKVNLHASGVITLGIGGRRRVAKFSELYLRIIEWCKRHKWILIVVLILGFGLPIHLLPTQLHPKNGKEEGFWISAYNKTIGSKWYGENRKYFEATLGGSFRLFSKGINVFNYYGDRTPSKSLNIRARMPEGCSVQQLNDVVREMENFLAGFDGIDIYRTRISSVDNANITVTFTKEAENTGFPYALRQQVDQKAASFGGASWSVWGVTEQGFSNEIGYNDYKSHVIRIKGYNYDDVYRYATQAIDSLKLNRRVSDIGIYADRNCAPSQNEFFLAYDKERVAHSGLNMGHYVNYLSGMLYDRSVGGIFDGQQTSNVRLVSSAVDSYDLWHIRHDLIDVDTVKSRLTDVGSIDKRRTGNNIVRTNQSYELYVGFDFVGPYELASRVCERTVKTLNEQILPMGYDAEVTRSYWSMQEQKTQIKLLLLIIALIFGICAILFESLIKPFIIILMIPIGFIGLFLSFSMFGVSFNQGGFAAMVMLAGLVVNAGIYIITEFDTIRSSSRQSDAKVYIKAYNRKIIPTLLTILSTVLGLIPFLFDGRENSFWFAFAVGVMGGMVLSIVALVIYLPVFLKLNT